MSVLSNLTLQNLKLNKTRTLVTLVGIILSTALLVALMGLVSSFVQTVLLDTIETSGDHHVTFDSAIPIEELDEIIYNKEVEKYYLAEPVDTYSYEETTSEEGIYSESILAMDANTLAANENKLLSGRLPANENEIMVSALYGTEDYCVGDKLVSDSGNIYTVVGTFSYATIFSSSYYITYMEEPIESAMVSLRYKNPMEYQVITDSLNGVEDGEGDGNYAYYYHTSLLQLEGNAISSENQRMVYAMSLIIAFIIVITSVFCIRNSFAISITEKTRQYGMLASVGATPKQIRKNVLFEGTILGLIGIPIGVLSGIFAVWILLMITNYLMPELVNMAFVLNIEAIPTFAAVLLSACTIYFSAIGSAVRASKISEIDAIRSTQDIKVKAKNIEAPKFIEKTFKIGGVFAYKNMKRNKSKFRTTTISLIVSIATFVSLSSFLNLGFQMANVQFEQLDYNIEVSNVPSNITKMEFYEDVSQMTENNLCMFTIHSYLYINEKYFTEQGAKWYLGSDMEETNLIVMGLEDEYFLAYQNSMGLEENLEQGVILDSEYFDEADEYKEIQILDFDKSTTLYLTREEGQVSDGVEVSVDRGTEEPIGGFGNYMTLYISNTKFTEIYGTDNEGYMCIYVDSQDAYTMQEKLEDYMEEKQVNFYVMNVVEEQAMMEKLLLLISIFLYGFITVIILVGLTNIFNSLSTNMSLRRKEFATLQSIGMTSSEFNKMITFESITYAVKSLMWGIPIGALGSYALYWASTQGDIEVSYQFPVAPILQSAVVVFLVVYGIMKTSLSKIAKQNIIETIRNENI